MAQLLIPVILAAVPALMAYGALRYQVGRLQRDLDRAVDRVGIIESDRAARQVRVESTLTRIETLLTEIRSDITDLRAGGR